LAIILRRKSERGNNLKVLKIPTGTGRQRIYLEAEALPGNGVSLLIFITLVAGLWLDHISPVWGQIAAGVLFWGLFLILYEKAEGKVRLLLMSGLLVAVAGEIFCSLIWQLYDYRLYNIPHYVPPGHLLVFLLGSKIAHWMPKGITGGVALTAILYIISASMTGIDQFGVLLVAIFLLCLFGEEEKKLYATMFVICLILEIYGTRLGNWTWRPEVPVWGLSTPNPPPSSGAFYCILDFIMLRLMLSLSFINGRLSAFTLSDRLKGAMLVTTEETES